MHIRRPRESAHLRPRSIRPLPVLPSMYSKPRKAQLTTGLLLSVTLFCLLLWSCVDRPIGTLQPRTTNVLTDNLVNTAVNKIDLLFVIDNSLSMADKQKLLGKAVPDLVDGLLQPSCIAGDGNIVARGQDGRCPTGSQPEFEPVDDIHVGVITSSLGGYGASVECSATSGPEAQSTDMAHLLGSLPRGQTAAPSATDGFLRWTKNSNREQFISELGALVTQSGERGCGWEAPLESWVRFLVDPHPYTEVVRRPCSAGDTKERCVGPATNSNGEQLVDTELLAQRSRFLRPDSLVAIIMLSDENDCSFRPSGQTWLLSQTRTEDRPYIPALKATDACELEGPNSSCCHSCGQVKLVPGCPTAIDDEGNTVAAGCELGLHYESSDGDPPNLRCFEQKRRFGVDMLYPVERYSNALKLKQICPFADDFSPESELCAGGVGLVPNPLFSDLSIDESSANKPPAPARPENLIFFAGIVGVPWQDVAVSTDKSQPLVYRTNSPPRDESAPPPIDWSWIVAGRDATLGVTPAKDPLMHESREPRTGTSLATGEPLAAPSAGPNENSINGHEWEAFGAGDLQYACVFPLESPEPCLTAAQLSALPREEQLTTPWCDCTEIGTDTYKSPLCQAPDGTYGHTQYSAKAYPSLRQLRALHDFGENSIVASICPKTTDPAAVDYGYRPAMAAIVERLKSQLGDKCYQRQLATASDGSTSCIIVEATPPDDEPGTCERLARSDVTPDVEESVRNRLLDSYHCEDETQCAAWQLCEIDQIRAETDQDGLMSCRHDGTAIGDGWCYIDEQLSLGNPDLVRNCPATARRKVRFAGAGRPEPNSVTVVYCAGASFDDL